MHSAIIGVGSNISPEENVRIAEREVGLLGESLRKSRFIYTKPLLYEKQDDFLNGVFHIDTPYAYDELNDRLKEIETRLGRVRTGNKSGPRTIDLDTVIYNNQIRDADVFTRDFIKNPVIELIPELEETLNCTNYKNHFGAIQGIIDKILSLLSAPPVSVFGAGSWFRDAELPADTIDILVIAEDAAKGTEETLNRELKGAGPGAMAPCPVNAQVFGPGELEGLAAADNNEAETDVRSVPSIPGFPCLRLLYGRPDFISISSS